MENIVTSFEVSKKILPLFNQIPKFGWFGDENIIHEEGKWLFVSCIEEDIEHKMCIGCTFPICHAYTIRDLMPFFAVGRNGEILNNAIQAKLNSGNQLHSFLGDPDFYGKIIIEINSKKL